MMHCIDTHDDGRYTLVHQNAEIAALHGATATFPSRHSIMKCWF